MRARAHIVRPRSGGWPFAMVHMCVRMRWSFGTIKIIGLNGTFAFDSGLKGRKSAFE